MIRRADRILLPTSVVAFLAMSAASATTILDAMPENGSLETDQVVYVKNDGRCGAGEVLRVTGGNRSKGIKRKVECVPRPE